MIQENIRMTIALVIGVIGIWGTIKFGIKVSAKEAESDQKVVWQLKKGYIDY